MSGLNFGHYKAASASTNLSNIHALMTHIAFNNVSPYDRWTKGLLVMLQKEAGVIRVNKLRAILLMEADFNFGNKLIFSKRMVEKLETQNRLPQKQFGSRKEHCAIKFVFNSRLIADLVRQKRRNTMIISADAAH